MDLVPNVVVSNSTGNVEIRNSVFNFRQNDPGDNATQKIIIDFIHFPPLLTTADFINFGTRELK